MHPALAQLIPIGAIGLSAAALFTLITYWEWQTKKTRKKNPLTSDLLRGPGEALREKIMDMRIDLFAYVLPLFLIPLLIFAMSLSHEVFAKKPSLFISYFYVVMAVVSVGYIFHKMLGLRKKIHLYTLGLDAEIAVGQELNHLMREGFWVYHDFPADEFNIDHVVIGPTGVFAIETKGRPKPIKDDGSTECEVTYDGVTLSFPTWKENKSVKQAEYQAKWLEKWLSSAVGEPVTVNPIPAIPGWFIKRTKPGGIPVINGKNPSAFFAKYGNSNLSEKLQRQIAHQVDNRCRTVLPKAYKWSNN